MAALACTVLAAATLAHLPLRAQSVPIGRYVELPYGLGQGHPYPMMGGDARRTGRANARLGAAPPEVVWKQQLTQRRLLPPTLLADGTLVVGSASGVDAFSATGEARWRVELGQVRFTPSVTPGGALLVATYEGKLWLVQPDGEARALESAASLSGLPLVLDGGAIVVGARDGHVHVLDQEGSELLQVPSNIREPFWSARVGGGLLAVAGSDRHLLLLSLQAGAERTVALSERVSGGLAVDDRGGIWVVGEQGTLFRVEVDGRVRSVAHFDERVATAPVLGRDGGVRLGLASREVVCVGADGSERWRRGLDGRPSELLLDVADSLLVLSARGTLHAIDADGALRWRVQLGVQRGARPVLAGDGTIYLVGRDGLFEALR